MGTFSARLSGSRSCCFRRALAAMRRCFFDLAVECQYTHRPIRVGCMGLSLQNKSPSASCPFPLSAAPLFCNTVHNHGGYSESSNATGSCLFFMKFSPLSTVPAGTLLCICSGFLLLSTSLLIGRSRLSGEGVKGVLKGCAADVDVAAGRSFGRGFVAVVVCAVTAWARCDVDCVKFRDVM